MSVFKKLKGSFQTAQQDIVDGIRALTSTDSQSRNVSSKQINLDAGADLLYRFQTNWSLIYHGTSESAQSAEEVAGLLTSVLTVWDKYAESVTNFEQETRKVSGVFATLAQLHALLDGLQQDFLIAEKQLNMLEDICEEQDFRNRCLKEQKSLAVYKAKKESEVEKLKVDFAQLHARKMAEIESVKKMNLQERAEAFMSAFQEDVNYYHTHGHHDRLPVKTFLVPSLSKIELDQDSQALDSFLGANGGSNEPGNLESSGEGVYFEDDYITDYSVKEDVDFLEESGYNSSSVIREMELEDSFYEKTHGYDNECPHDEVTDGLERVDDNVCDISQTRNDNDPSFKDNKNNEEIIE
ncbi:unnamed protein product [Candidula unifasciata]|uniref:Dysbindin n=1 Tax=Candidula unifasciata TaxID=100452 RepID=A0A8S3ZU99_9EUPU|nr:unnamed protein product [Candidula unifasciata]